jgi:hypothetical protein
MSHKAADYRKRAREARERAAWLSSSEAREHLLELAVHLDLLAETEERWGQRRPEPPSHTRGPGAPDVL